MPLKVIDKTGRLPKNPKDWPAELRRAIAECCCSDSSSDSSSSGGGGGGTPQDRLITCCPGLVLPETIYATITGGTAIDGSYPLTFTNDPVKMQWNPFVFPQEGWVSDFTLHLTCITFGGFVTTEYWFSLCFAKSCGLNWMQWYRTTVGGTFTPFFINAQMNNADLIRPIVCNPLDIYMSLGDQANGIYPRPYHDCLLNREVNNSGPPTWAGPKVEITL